MAINVNAIAQNEAQANNRVSFTPFAEDRSAEAEERLLKILAEQIPPETPLREEDTEEFDVYDNVPPEMKANKELGDYHRRLKILGLNADEGTIAATTAQPQIDRDYAFKKDSWEWEVQKASWQDLAQQYNIVDSQIQENGRALTELQATIQAAANKAPYLKELNRLKEREQFLKSRKEKLEAMVADKDLPATKLVLPDKKAYEPVETLTPKQEREYITQANNATRALQPIFAKLKNNMNVRQVSEELNKLGMRDDIAFATDVLGDLQTGIETATAEEKRLLDLQNARRGERLSSLDETQKFAENSAKIAEIETVLKAAASFLKNQNEQNALNFKNTYNQFLQNLSDVERKSLSGVVQNLKSYDRAATATQAKNIINKLTAQLKKINEK